MKKIILLLVSLFLFNTAASAKNVPVYTEDKSVITVTKADPEFTLKIQSNPTTGYSWYLRDYDSDLVKPVKHQFLPGTSQLVGAPGHELWTFRMKPEAFTVPQQTVIHLVYARPWESTNDSKQLVFRVTTVSYSSISHSQKSE